MVNPGIEHARLRVAGAAPGSRVRLRGAAHGRARAEGRRRRAPRSAARSSVEGETKPAAFGDFHVVYFRLSYALAAQLADLDDRVACASRSPGESTVGDRGNRGAIEEAARKAEAAGRLARRASRDGAHRATRRWTCSSATASCATSCASSTRSRPRRRGIAIALGAVLPVEGRGPQRLANARGAAARAAQRVAAQAKTLLPTYDVFDEKRYFAAGRASASAVPLGAAAACARAHGLRGRLGRAAGLRDRPGRRARGRGRRARAELSASPFHVGKAARAARAWSRALARAAPRADRLREPGRRERRADLRRRLVRRRRARAASLASLPHFDAGARGGRPAGAEPGSRRTPCPSRSAPRSSRPALVLGIRDYFRKQDLPPGAVIGLSGGIDSAVTAHLAVEALGRRARWLGVAMPGPFSSDHSVEDALALGAEPRHRGAHRRHPADLRGLPRARSARSSARARLRAHAAEHPVAHPRRAAHGGLERREPARARDRQQERALGRLLHALRRHGGRARGARRRLQARRLRARAPREPRARAHPARTHREAAVGRARAGPARQRRPARLRRARRRPRARRSRAGAAPRRSSRRPARRASCARHRARGSTATSTSAARRRWCCASRPRRSAAGAASRSSSATGRRGTS